MNLVDTLTVLFFALVVFLMFPGLTLFYSGLVSYNNVLTTTLKCYICLFIVSVQWIIIGYSLAFNEFSLFVGGLKWLFLNGVGYDTKQISQNIPDILFMFYQMLFAGLATVIIAGSVVERIKFSAFVIFIIMWTTLVYDPLAHMFWATGGLFTNYHILDFAGGNVVHVSSGVSGLLLALTVGRRIKNNNSNSNSSHLMLTIFGGSILYFGWFGFNAGNSLALNNVTILVIINTHVAGAVGGLSWLLSEYIFKKKVSILGAITGVIAGLVGITPACAYVNLTSAMLIGFIASFMCYIAIYEIKILFKYDDSLDAFGVHGIGGIAGSIGVALFSSKQVNPAGENGLFYGETTLFFHQLLSTLFVVVFCAIMSFLIITLIRTFMKLRVNVNIEKIGLDTTIEKDFVTK